MKISTWKFSRKIVAGAIVFTCALCIGSFFTEDGNLLAEIMGLGFGSSYISEYLSFGERIQLKLLESVFTLNKYRFLFILPMIYPGIQLFQPKFQKKFSIISSAIGLLMALYFMAIGKDFMGYKAGLLVISSIVMLIGVLSVDSTRLKKINTLKSCITCGSDNNHNAKFCIKCGTVL